MLLTSFSSQKKENFNLFLLLFHWCYIHIIILWLLHIRHVADSIDFSSINDICISYSILFYFILFYHRKEFSFQLFDYLCFDFMIHHMNQSLAKLILKEMTVDYKLIILYSRKPNSYKHIYSKSWFWRKILIPNLNTTLVLKINCSSYLT